VPAGWQVCNFQPAVIRLSVRLLMRSCLYATQSWHLNNLTWSIDFVMDALASGRRIKCLTCLDDFTKECLTITAAFGMNV
jgi:hypothetical protein